MSRLAPKSDVLRALFTRSGNRCAFPGCTASLVNERNQFIAQVCHIEAAEPGGERFNPYQSDEERRQYGNFLILCYPHHVETDDVATYTVERLRIMKLTHEQLYERRPFKIDEALLYKIAAEMEQYWLKVEELHKNHVVPELAIEINPKASFAELIAGARTFTEDFRRLQEMLIDSDDALPGDLDALLAVLDVSKQKLDACREQHRHFQNRNWGILNIGLTNTATKLEVVLCQLELKYLEVFLQLTPNEKTARLRLDTLKKEFETIATSAGYVD